MLPVKQFSTPKKLRSATKQKKHSKGGAVDLVLKSSESIVKQDPYTLTVTMKASSLEVQAQVSFVSDQNKPSKY